MPRPHASLFIATLIGLAACGSEQHAAPAASGPPVPVTLALAHEEPLAVTYRASGTVRGRTTVVLTSKVSGYVRAVHASAGNQVAAGQLLVDLEVDDIRAGVGRGRAELSHAVESRAEAEGAVEAARAAAALAKTSRERMAQLLASGAITRQAFDEADAEARTTSAQLRAAEARLRAASSGIDVAKASLAESKATLGYARVVAPFAGRIVERRVDPGTLASPATPLLVLEDRGTPRVEVPVEESRGASIRIGDPVVVALGDEIVTGTVGEIVPSVDVASRAFLVKIDLPAAAGALQPGAFARVAFKEGTRRRLVVPTSAITRLGALDRVFVVDKDVAHLRMVSLGESDGPWTEVLAGLTSGERVVTTPGTLVDGARVEVRP